MLNPGNRTVRVLSLLLVILIVGDFIGEHVVWSRLRQRERSRLDLAVQVAKVRQGLYEMERTVGKVAATGDIGHWYDSYKKWRDPTHDALFAMKDKLGGDAALTATFEKLRKGIAGWDYFVHRLMSYPGAPGAKGYYSESPSVDGFDRNQISLETISERIDGICREDWQRAAKISSVLVGVAAVLALALGALLVWGGRN